MPLPKAIDYALEHVPAELRRFERWMPFRFAARKEWKPGQPAWSKLPIDPRNGKPGSVADPAVWANWDEAVAYLRLHMNDENPWTVAHGLGMVVAEPYTVFDLDHHVVAGEPDEFAASILAELNTYCEISVSGDGLHGIGRAELAVDGRRDSKKGLEVYCRRRYLTVTGVFLGAFKEIQDRQAEFERLVANLSPAPVHFNDGGQKSPYIHRCGGVIVSEASQPQPDCQNRHAPVRSDEEVLRLIRRDPKAARLWRGDSSGYPSPSEADAALTVKLLFYTARNSEQTDRLFRQSALFRAEKWDRPCGGATVGRHTIAQVGAWMREVRIHPPSRAPRKRGRPLSSTTAAVMQLVADASNVRPATLVKRLGVKLPYAKKLIQRARARLKSGEVVSLPAAPAVAAAGNVHGRPAPTPKQRRPSLASFLEFTRLVSGYRPERRRLERLFSSLCRYAALQQFALREGHFKDCWDQMLEWRDWASRNEHRAKRLVRRSLREFLRLALISIESQSGHPAFSLFRCAVADYYRALGKYCPPDLSVLGGYLDLMDRFGAHSSDALHLAVVKDALRNLTGSGHPPLRIDTVVDRLSAHLLDS